MNGTASYAAEICRLYVLLLLVAASAGKAVRRESFEGSVAALVRLDPRAARAAAAGVIASEAGIALLLLAGGRPAAAGMAAALLLFTLFSIAIAVALAKGRRISCNCFGGGGGPITGHDLVRNGMLIAAALFYLVQAPKVQGLDIIAWALLGGTALILLLVSANLGEIAALAR